MRYAQILANVIANVIEADAEFAATHNLTLVQGLSPEPGIGWTLAAGTWTPPVPDPALAVAQTLQQRATNALAANATFLALAAPSTAQAVAQVGLLTRECNGLIRLLLGALDSTAGT